MSKLVTEYVIIHLTNGQRVHLDSFLKGYGKISTSVPSVEHCKFRASVLLYLENIDIITVES